jgi:mannose-6-phosphate isomerase-like protein (cupin superfamily)
MIIHGRDVRPFIGDDGAVVRELASPANSSLRTHSLAEIVFEPGRSSFEHHHRATEEVYHILAGAGEMTLDGTSQPIGPGDTVVIVPGVKHRLRNVGTSDLVIMAICVPAFSPGDQFFSMAEA